MLICYPTLRLTGGQIRFGVSELKKALAARGIPVAEERIDFYTGEDGPTIAVTLAPPGTTPAESFVLRRDGDTVSIIGGDETGALYGLLDVRWSRRAGAQPSFRGDKGPSALEGHCRGGFEGNVVGHLDEVGCRDIALFCIGAHRAEIADPVARLEEIDPLAQFGDDPRRLGAGHEGCLVRIKAGAVVDVDEVDAHRFVPDPHLARTGRRVVRDPRSSGPRVRRMRERQVPYS